jgi:multidrug efflux pump subunit AcrA (membrane-fusion protein)
MRLRLLLFPALAVLLAGGLWVLQRPATPAIPGGHGDAPAVGGGVPRLPGPAAAGQGPFRTEPVRTATIPRTEKVPARVRGARPVVVRTPLRGTPVQKILHREGEAVAKGDVLFVLSGENWRRSLEEAGRKGDAEALAKAKEALASLEVRAPEDGIVFRIDATLGEVPPVGRDGPLPLGVLFDWKGLSYEGRAPAALAEILREGAEVWVGSSQGILTRAKVTRRGEPGPDGDFALEVEPVDPPAEAPDPEREAEIRVQTGTREALVVPAGALRTEEGRGFVYTVGVTGDLKRCPVVVGIRLPSGRVEVSGVDRNAGVAVWE